MRIPGHAPGTLHKEYKRSEKASNWGKGSKKAAK